MNTLGGWLEFAGTIVTLIGAVITMYGLFTAWRRVAERVRGFRQRIRGAIDRMAAVYESQLPPPVEGVSFALVVPVSIRMEGRVRRNRSPDLTLDARFENVWAQLDDVDEELQRHGKSISELPKFDAEQVSAEIRSVKREIANEQRLIEAADLTIAVAGAVIAIVGTAVAAVGIGLGLFS